MKDIFWRTIFDDNEKKKLLNLNYESSYEHYNEAYKKFEGDDIYEKFAYADMKVWWQSMGLYQGDTMSMANSLELRMPFMDHKLVEYVSNLPRQKKFNNGKLKILIKNISKSYLPNNIINLPKSGFHVPFAEWFVLELKSFVYEKLSYKRVSKIPNLNYDKVINIVENHMKLVEDNSFKILSLIIFVEWYFKFVKE